MMPAEYPRAKVMIMKIDMNNLNGIKPLRPAAASAEQQLEGAEEVRDTFRKFVGEAFFGQMLKSMRSTQGKPAYFHGGHAEEVFQSQLDQVMSEEMTEASADRLPIRCFANSFPHQAACSGSRREAIDAVAQRSWVRCEECNPMKRRPIEFSSSGNADD